MDESDVQGQIRGKRSEGVKDFGEVTRDTLNGTSQEFEITREVVERVFWDPEETPVTKGSPRSTQKREKECGAPDHHLRHRKNTEQRSRFEKGDGGDLLRDDFFTGRVWSGITLVDDTGFIEEE